MRAASTFLRSHGPLMMAAGIIFMAKFLWLCICYAVMLFSVSTLQFAPYYYLEVRSPSGEPSAFVNGTTVAIEIIVLIIWLLGAISTTNFFYFETASITRRWCLDDHVNQRHTRKCSIKQIFATYLGSICCGSLPKRPIEVRAISEHDTGVTRFDRIYMFIFERGERVVGCITRLPLVYEALTGHPYSRATEITMSLFDRCRQMVLLNTVIYFYIIEVSVVLMASVISGIFSYKCLMSSSTRYIDSIAFHMNSFSIIISYSLISSVTLLLKSVSSAAFTCFLMYPAEFYTLDPEYFQSLTDFWNRYYSTEPAIRNGLYDSLASNTDENL